MRLCIRGSSFVPVHFLSVECGIERIEVPAVQFFLDDPKAFSEPLIVHDLAFSQKADGIADLGIFYKPEDIVISGAGLLFCCHIFMEICDGVAFGLEDCGSPGGPACGLRPERQSVIHVVGTEAGTFDLLGSEILCELVYDGADHFHVGEFFRSYRSIRNVPLHRNARKASIYGLFSGYNQHNGQAHKVRKKQ